LASRFPGQLSVLADRFVTLHEVRLRAHRVNFAATQHFGRFVTR